MHASKVIIVLVAALAIQAQVAEAHFFTAFWIALLSKGYQGAPAAPPTAKVVVPAPPTAKVPATPPTAKVPTTPPTAPSPPSGKAPAFPNVAAAAIATPQLSTLVEVASSVGLADVLADPNLVATVLAPNNAAFSALLSRLNLSLDQLLANPDLVRLVLSYHLIPGVAATAASLTNNQVLPTGNDGETLTVLKTSGGGVQFQPSGPNAPTATVVTPDITAGKAIVHIIDQVLIPANFQLPGGTTGGGAATGGRANATAAGTAAGAATGTTTRVGAGTTTGATGAGTTTGGTTGGGGGTTGGTGTSSAADTDATGGYSTAGGGRKLLRM